MVSQIKEIIILENIVTDKGETFGKYIITINSDTNLILRHNDEFKAVCNWVDEPLDKEMTAIREEIIEQIKALCKDIHQPLSDFVKHLKE